MQFVCMASLCLTDVNVKYAGGLVFVVSIHASTPRLEMGVSDQMLGVKAPFRFEAVSESHLLACNVSWNFVLV